MDRPGHSLLFDGQAQDFNPGGISAWISLALRSLFNGNNPLAARPLLPLLSDDSVYRYHYYINNYLLKKNQPEIGSSPAGGIRQTIHS